MSAPLTQTQIPNDSIMDIFGRQTYLGNSFILPMPGGALTNTAETPLAVIKNPSGSGKSLFLFSRKLTSDNNNAVIRFYLNPTLNVPGTTTTALNLRSKATTTSISTCYLSASITSNGSLITALPALAASQTIDILYILDPGSTMLVTGQQSGAGTSNIYSENAWYEI